MIHELWVFSSDVVTSLDNISGASASTSECYCFERPSEYNVATDVSHAIFCSFIERTFLSVSSVKNANCSSKMSQSSPEYSCVSYSCHVYSAVASISLHFSTIHNSLLVPSSFEFVGWFLCTVASSCFYVCAFFPSYPKFHVSSTLFLFFSNFIVLYFISAPSNWFSMLFHCVFMLSVVSILTITPVISLVVLILFVGLVLVLCPFSFVDLCCTRGHFGEYRTRK